MNSLKKYLIKKGESTASFARKAEVSQPTIWRIINGETKQISPNTAQLIEKATGGEVTVLALLYPNEKAA